MKKTEQARLLLEIAYALLREASARETDAGYREDLDDIALTIGAEAELLRDWSR